MCKEQPRFKSGLVFASSTICLAVVLPIHGRSSVANAATVSNATSDSSVAETASVQNYISSLYSQSDVKHSFQTKAGDTIDCVDFFATPGAKEMAARGAPLTALPQPPLPPFGKSTDAGPATDEDWFNGYPDALGRARACPSGTAPVVRPTASKIQAAGGLDSFLARSQKQSPPPPAYECPNLREIPGYAHVIETASASGPNAGITEAGTTWSLFNAANNQMGWLQQGYPKRGGHSILQLWLMTGCGLHLPQFGIDNCGDSTQDDLTCMRTVEVGTISYSGDANLYFILYGTNQGYKTSATFVPYGSYIANGQAFTTYGHPGGLQYEWFAVVELVQGQGYWVFVGPSQSTGQWIGYFPTTGNNYTGPFVNSAEGFQVGGEVYDPYSEWLGRMGSGAAASAGYGQAAYFYNSTVLANGSWNSNFVLGQGNYSQNGSTVPTDYMISTSGGHSGWSNFFYVGGAPRVFLWNGQNYGYQWSQWGDWAPNQYKGECALGAFITGVSSSGGTVHALQCGVNGMTGTGSSGCYNRNFRYGDNRGYSTGDWDWGYRKGECYANEIVQGIAMEQNGVLDDIWCCPSFVAHNSCHTEVFYSGNSVDYSGTDWDPRFYKGECPLGQYVAGISATTNTGSPHAIRCCSP